MHGTQISATSNQSFNNYASDAGLWKHYDIRLGDYFTGLMQEIVFINDNDSAASHGDSAFRNLLIV